MTRTMVGASKGYRWHSNKSWAGIVEGGLSGDCVAASR